MHADPALGYRIGLPPTYRLALSVVDGENLGHDAFTPRSEAEDRALCARQGQQQSPERVADLRVVVHNNSAGVTPVAFPRWRSHDSEASFMRSTGSEQGT